LRKVADEKRTLITLREERDRQNSEKGGKKIAIHRGGRSDHASERSRWGICCICKREGRRSDEKRSKKNKERRGRKKKKKRDYKRGGRCRPLIKKKKSEEKGKRVNRQEVLEKDSQFDSCKKNHPCFSTTRPGNQEIFRGKTSVEKRGGPVEKGWPVRKGRGGLRGKEGGSQRKLPRAKTMKIGREEKYLPYKPRSG